MYLFLIRNFISIQSAEEIITTKNSKAIGIIVSNPDKLYREKLASKLNRSLWVSVFINESSFPSLSKNFFRYLENLCIYSTFLTKILTENNISEVFLSNLQNKEDKHIYFLARKHRITINLFEEGLALYTGFTQETLSFKYVLKFLLSYFPSPISHLYKNKIKYKTNILYTYLPDKYTQKNIKEKVRLNFRPSNKYYNLIIKKDIQTLFLTQPLSEDGLITVGQELLIIEEFVSTTRFSNLYIKFHPRDNSEKIKLIQSKFDFKLLPNNLQHASAEEIVWYSNIENLVGYYSTTLAYMSELKKDINVYSLLRLLATSNDNLYLLAVYNLFKNKFKKVFFI